MGAASLLPDPTIQLSATAVPSGLLAIAVALATFIIVVLALAGAAIEVRDRRRSELETERMRGLANAAVEGLVVCDSEIVATVNNSFAILVGSTPDDMVGTALEQWLPEQRTRLQLLERPDQPVEGELLHSDGSRMPVELILRSIDFGGKPHRAIAVRDLRARKQAERHIRFLAHHDVLTGLPNRSFFNKKLDQEIETCLVTGRSVAVLCLDLDRFKEINDLFGHAAGDRMLQVVAGRITALLDDSQTMARLSGDEFAILIPGLSDPSVAGRIAENILDDLQAANTKAETDALVSTSIGIAICPDDATDRNALLTHADTAPLPRQERWARLLSLLRGRDGRRRARPSYA
jgi:diguanylate cyclase (GGDEF)-like protein/PAS domain S-box-containing protein